MAKQTRLSVRRPMLNIDHTAVLADNAKRDLAPYQGWSNMATWCYSLYFLQVEKHYDWMVKQFRTGQYTIAYVAAYMRESGIRIDHDCDGMVSVQGIMDTLASGLSPAKKETTTV